MQKMRVLLVDDHPMVRRGLRSLLSYYPDIEIVGEAADGAAAVQASRELAPDIVILDVKLPGADGLTVARRLRNERPEVKVVVLSAHDNEEYVLGAIRAGAYAYILKSTSDETIVDAVRMVHEGRHLLSPSLMDKVLEQFRTLSETHARDELGLSDQECQLLMLLAQGASNPEVSQEMYWSDRTVKRKVQEVLDKLGARNRAQAVAEALKRGVI